MEDDKAESQPVLSNPSTHSTKSVVSMEAAKARAKAEATQARASFAKKEMELKTEKACLEAKLDALEKEREAAVMEAAVEDLVADESQHSSAFHLPQQSLCQHTEEYVMQHRASSDSSLINEDTKPASHTISQVPHYNMR